MTARPREREPFVIRDTGENIAAEGNSRTATPSGPEAVSIQLWLPQVRESVYCVWASSVDK